MIESASECVCVCARERERKPLVAERDLGHDLAEVLLIESESE